VKSPSEIYLALQKHRPGDTVDLTVYRDGRAQKVQVKLSKVEE
jgi:S1-C subfamily serine protease